MKRILLLILMVSVSLSFTPNDFFTNLSTNYADINHGVAIFTIHNPTNVDITISPKLLNYYVRFNTTPMIKQEIYLQQYVNYSCIINSTYFNDSLDVNITYGNCSGYLWVPFNNTVSIPKTNYLNVEIIGRWMPTGLGVSRDWVPYINVSNTIYEKPEWQTWNGTEIFYDEFTTMDSSWTGWAPINSGWNLTTTTVYNTTDNSAAEGLKVGSSGLDLIKNLSLYGWKDINISLQWNTSLGASDYFYASYWDGFIWTKFISVTALSQGWNYTSVIADAQDLPNFRLNFTCRGANAADRCTIDALRINGWPSNWTQNIINDSTVNNFYAMDTGDANNDGITDVVVGTSGGTIRLYENVSGGWKYSPIKTISGIDIMGVAIGDANNDSLNEVVVVTSSTGFELRSYTNTSGMWVETNISDYSNTVISVAIGDANNDGTNEIVTGAYATTEGIRVVSNLTATGWSNLTTNTTANTVRSVVIGDANNDGLNEVVYGMTTVANDVRVLKNSSGRWNSSIISNSALGAYAVAIGDANNDGQNEVVSGHYKGTNETRMYKNVSGRWNETNISNFWNSTNSIDIGSMNGTYNIVVVGLLVSGAASNISDNIVALINKSGGWIKENIGRGRDSINAIKISNITDATLGNELVVAVAWGNAELRYFNTTYYSGEAPPTYSFSVTLPSANYSNSSTSSPGNPTNTLNFSYNCTDSNPCWNRGQAWVNLSSNDAWQTTATPGLIVYNYGSTTVTMTLLLNTTLPSYVKLLINNTNTMPPLAWWTLTSAGDSLTFSVSSGGTQNLWVYANFTNVTAEGETQTYNQLNYTSA